MASRRLRLIGGLLICLCLAYTAGIGAYQVYDKLTREPDSIRVFWQAWDRIEKHFYGEIPSARERTYGAVRGSLTQLGDPYTVFVEPHEHELERDQMRGSYGGIGVSLWRDMEGQVLLSPYPDSPAERAGIREDDILLAINGDEVTAEDSLSAIESDLHGETGTPVTLTLPHHPSLVITRAEVEVPSVSWRALAQEPAIAHLRVERFTERTTEEVSTALQEMQTGQISGLILDLRDNTGGLLSPAIEVADQFLESVVIMRQVTGEQERVFRGHAGGLGANVALVVLINGNTASAAEIVAGALQDHGRATLIGQPTFGKGSVQHIYELSDGSSLHVTTAVWLTPKRHQINQRGLTPDILAPADEQLDQAVSHLQSQ